MELTLEQKQEVSDIVSASTIYRESFNEVHDHVLNELNHLNVNYKPTLIIEIFNNDYGGIAKMLYNEKVYAKNFTKRYFQFFRTETLNTFKWPHIISNIALLMLCGILYGGFLKNGLNTTWIIASTCIITFFLSLFYYFKRYFLDRNEQKPSVKYAFLKSSTEIGLSINFFVFFFVYF